MGFPNESSRPQQYAAGYHDNRSVLMRSCGPRPFVGASIHGARKQEPVQNSPYTWVFHIAGSGYLFIRSTFAVSYRPCVTSFLQGPNHFLKRDREIGPFLLKKRLGIESKKWHGIVRFLLCHVILLQIRLQNIYFTFSRMLYLQTKR